MDGIQDETLIPGESGCQAKQLDIDNGPNTTAGTGRQGRAWS